jgi:hypothetical protein
MAEAIERGKGGRESCEQEVGGGSSSFGTRSWKD